MIVHTSDFAGTAKTFAVSQEWSRRVNIEFTKQSEKEAELGITMTPMMQGLHRMKKWSQN